MARQIATGIDIGTYQVKVVIAEEVKEGNGTELKIIGTGLCESRGLKNGYIINRKEATESIMKAVRQAEKASGVSVKRAFVSIGGVGLSSVSASGSNVVSRADLEVTGLDVEKALEAAEAAIPGREALNKKIINTIPVDYKADGKLVLGRIEGIKAQKIDIKTLFIMCLDHHLEDLIKAVEEADIEVIDVVAAPIAASFVTVSKKHKRAGSILANIGAETLSIIVFENNNPISLEVFPFGGNDITNDIALGLKVSLEEAESIKLGAVTGTNVSKKKLDEIIQARLSDCFELIETHLKKINRNALLPAGIVLTGGGSKLANIKEFAESSLKLPAIIGDIHFGETKESNPKTKDPAWSVACGLALLGFSAEGTGKGVGGSELQNLTNTIKGIFKKIGVSIGKFLP